MSCYLALYLIAFVVCPTIAKPSSSAGPDYEHLPQDTVFPGPWEENIRSPANKSYIQAVEIFAHEGPVFFPEAVLNHGTSTEHKRVWNISTGGLVTFQFEENTSGKVCFDVRSFKHNPQLILSYSESPFFADRECDATGDYARDLPLRFAITKEGVNCVPDIYNRGGFKYLTIYLPESEVPAEGDLYKDNQDKGRSKFPAIGQDGKQQVVLESKHRENKTSASLEISSLWVNCTAFPSQQNGRAYTGYFHSSSSLLNRIWYSGAWTLQMSTIIPTEGGALIDFNKNFDHNQAPPGGWFANFTVAHGNVVTTDGAKRDRMVWPGDMAIAIPGIAVSTYDMIAVRNALNIIYDLQYFDGSLPYAGPPMGARGEFSDTYHLHSLLGTYYYILYTGDMDWLKTRWRAYTRALAVSISKVDDKNLLHVSSTYDWNRWGMTGHNVEASAILYQVLENSIDLAHWLGKMASTNGEGWESTRSRLKSGLRTLYCPADGLFADNIGRRSCNGSEKVLPQDGNGWVLLANVFDGPDDADLRANVSTSLRNRWNKFGAPAPEFPNVMSPFSSSFELMGHAKANKADAAIELMELMWGYMLDGPGMTNSTTIEGYRTDGYVHYPAYPSISRNSHAHGWSTGPTSVLLQGILGIQLKSPLGKTWVIAPQLSKWLSHARGGFATKLGKFEVSIALMKHVSSGLRVEAVNVTVPVGTTGTVEWGGRSYVHTADKGEIVQWWRVVDTEATQEDEWRVWRESDELVPDDSWTKPEGVKREPGVVDWDLLEKGYALASKAVVKDLSSSSYP